MANKKQKKKYQKPRLHKIGRLQDLSQTASNSGATDGGSAPYNLMMCLTSPSHIDEHRALLSDASCQNSYLRIIETAIRPGDVVLDLGTGSGIHSLFALKCGAKKVYAVDSHSIIHTARQILRQNGLSDRLEFIQGNSNEIELPEKVDLIISNVGFMSSINYLPDAMRRFLKPGGRAVPDGLQLVFAPISSPEIFTEQIDFWNQEKFGYDFSPFKELAANYPIYLHLKNENLIGDFVAGAPIQFSEPSRENYKWELNFDIQQKSIIHGVGGWYNFLHNGRTYLSTKPPIKMAKELWNNFLFPLPSGLKVKAGDQIAAKIVMQPHMMGPSPLWQWQIHHNDEPVAQQSSLRSFFT